MARLDVAVPVSSCVASNRQYNFLLALLKAVKAVALALLLLPALLGTGWSQINPAAGIQPFSTHVTGIYDSVDLATGNILVQIPVRNKAGKQPFSYSLMMNSSAYQGINDIQTSTLWIISNWFEQSGQLQGALSLGLSIPVEYSGTTQQAYTCEVNGTSTNYSPINISGFYTADSTGTGRFFSAGSLGIWFDLPASCAGDLGPTSGTFVSSDGLYTLIVSANIVDGFLDNPGLELYDQFGNIVGFEYLKDPDGSTISGFDNDNILGITDTLGTQALTWNAGHGLAFSYTDGANNSQSFTTVYSTYTVQTAFDCPNVPDEPPSSMSLPSSITTPTGTITFTYETTPGDKHNPHYVTGRLAGIGYLNGGSVSYTYSGGSNNSGITCGSPQVVPTLTRTVNDGLGNVSTWTYKNSWNGNIATSVQNFTVTETDPAQNQTLYNFSSEVQTQVQYFQGAATGTPLKTVVTCYGGHNTSRSSCVSPTTTIILSGQSANQTDVYTYLGSSSSPSLVETQRDSLFDVTAIKNYDFGATFPPSGTPISTTTITYDYPSASGGAYPCGTLSNPYIRAGHPCSVTTTNSSGTIVSQTNYAYNSTGHPITTSRRVNSSSSLTSSATYNANGTVATATDVNGAVLKYAYNGAGGCNNLLLTSTSFPVDSLTTSQTWNCNGGVIASTTDMNSNQTTYSYNDPLWRQTKVSYPDGGSTTTTYNTGSTFPWSISTSNAINSTTNLNNTTIFDGLGRVTETQLTSDPLGTDYTDTTYNSVGEVYTVSNPYRAKTESTYGLTTYTYDALGRVTTLTHPDGTSVSTTYTGRATLVADEGNGNTRVQRISQVDGLGRVTSVCEVTSNSLVGISGTPAACGQDIAATGFLTSHTYDALGNLLAVAQGGLNGRTYVYDGLSRLISETNPESGTVTYTYNGAGDLYQRTGPTATTTYTYDALHRTTTKAYSDGSPSVGYYYDQSNPWGLAQYEHNYLGRLTQAQVQGPKINLTGTVFSYDAMGRIANEWQCTPVNCGTTSTYMAYTYDLLGGLISSYNNTDNITYTNTYNGAGELTSVQSSLSDSQHPGTLATLSNFTAFQKPGQIAYGNGITDTFEYDTRLRIYALNHVGQYAYNIQTGSSTGYAPNGDILFANDSANGNWAYAYDDMNRVISGTCSANCPATAGFTYTYDRFGNRHDETVTAGSGVQPEYAFNANNQIDVSGVTYDAAGNVIADGVGLGNTYTYDAENRIVTAANGYSASYVYDAFGHRVRSTVNGQTRDFLYDLNGRTIDQLTGGSLTRSEAYAGGLHVATYANSTTAFDNSDWLGTSRVRSNVSGTNIESCTSLPFGEDFTCNSTDVSPLHFTGQEHDWESGDDHFPFRYYSETMGKFLAPDPAGLAAVDPSNPQSWNRYAYALNNPLSYIDPTGLFCVWDDGSYDSAQDSDTGSPTNCGAAGGNWFDGNPSDWGLNADWSSQANANFVNRWLNQQPDYTFQTQATAQMDQTGDSFLPGGVATAENNGWSLFGWDKNAWKTFFKEAVQPWKDTCAQTFAKAFGEGGVVSAVSNNLEGGPGTSPDEVINQAGTIAAAQYVVNQGLVCPGCSSIYRGILSGTETAATGFVLLDAYTRIGQGLYEEGKSYLAGECR
jgi:RHS repeat-associated protein